MSDREASMDVIQRELTSFARRARQKAAQLHPELSLVAHSMLDHMDKNGSCHAADLAGHFMLDKSTVSRQITMLEAEGMIVRETDPDDHRRQIVKPSEKGLDLLKGANRQRRASFEERFTDWDDTDVAQLAAYLRSYNAADVD
ncbi:MarR family winged helix-turn-helix transcriptional regulator [Streptomyces chiangmaiensis]|uniref:MarR family winged helix-turn-helix transcriptional regulator n=1 Tax=Streptomyces chiangmaiensis TaxID=766497 RepID=A0ABU7FIC0_9ACTN|nr:MarR family winged helix-turn-helix transcriptional regulator [Streptomyces chiangmaiensis]MED7822894.1 MarR family winged helix-turn-helix transcriptional regulator [Streptomyces chiangmaiensis]